MTRYASSSPSRPPSCSASTVSPALISPWCTPMTLSSSTKWPCCSSQRQPTTPWRRHRPCRQSTSRRPSTSSRCAVCRTRTQSGSSPSRDSSPSPSPIRPGSRHRLLPARPRRVPRSRSRRSRRHDDRPDRPSARPTAVRRGLPADRVRQRGRVQPIHREHPRPARRDRRVRLHGVGPVAGARHLLTRSEARLTVTLRPDGRAPEPELARQVRPDPTDPRFSASFGRGVRRRVERYSWELAVSATERPRRGPEPPRRRVRVPRSRCSAGCSRRRRGCCRSSG